MAAHILSLKYFPVSLRSNLYDAEISIILLTKL